MASISELVSLGASAACWRCDIDMAVQGARPPVLVRRVEGRSVTSELYADFCSPEGD